MADKVKIALPQIPIRDAVRKKCLDCTGNQETEITQCTAYSCPLWPYRLGDSTAKAIKTKSLKTDRFELVDLSGKNITCRQKIKKEYSEERKEHLRQIRKNYLDKVKNNKLKEEN